MAGRDWTTRDVIAAYQRAVAGEQRRVNGVVQLSAIAHQAALIRAYPGGIRNGVRIERRNDSSWAVRATAPHTGMWESGTARRRTGRGYDRGISPRHGAVFIPSAVRIREQMNRSIQAILDRPIEV